jgi:CDP-glucose 4,6-dehydratase
LAVTHIVGEISKGTMEDLVIALQELGKKRILITGHTGFKGSWLTEWLLKYGAEITGVALEPDYSPSHFEQLGLDKRIKHNASDIRNIDRLKNIFREANPEVVFHLAAQPLVRRSYNDPKETFDTNVGGSINVLESVRMTPSVEALVYVTSDKCYLNKELERGYTEVDELGGIDPYSASKASAELAFATYQVSFFADRVGFAAASARAGNVVGGGDWSEDRIVPDCMRALMSREPISLRRPNATRPWQHVLEPLSGYITLASNLLMRPQLASGSWNFGPNEDSVHSVLDVVHECLANWGHQLPIESQDSNHHEAGLLQLNCDKAKQKLGWHPRWDFERTMKETTDWYKRASQGEHVAKITQDQITRYEETSND